MSDAEAQREALLQSARADEVAQADLLAVIHQDDCVHGDIPDVCGRCDE